MLGEYRTHASWHECKDGVRSGVASALQECHCRRTTYDGMELIFRALEAAKGVTDGDVLINVMKGLQWVSPRGPVQIDPATRDIIQNIYMRKVERQGAELYNVEFQTFPAIKDPAH